MHHVEIETVVVFVMGSVFNFDVVVARCIYMAYLINLIPIVSEAPLLRSVLNPNFW